MVGSKIRMISCLVMAIGVAVGRDVYKRQLSIMLTIIQAAIAPWEHGIAYQDVQKLYDRWLEEGGNQMELFTEVLMPTLAVSGFFTEKQAASMMENLKDVDELL